MTTKDNCLYCGIKTKEDDRHFISDCCGVGMCTECFNNLQGTEEQIQLDYWDREDDDDKILEINGWNSADYICFECFGTAQAIYEVTKMNWESFKKRLAEDYLLNVSIYLTNICKSLGIDLNFHYITDGEESIIVARTGNLIKSFNVQTKFDNIRDFKNYLLGLERTTI